MFKIEMVQSKTISEGNNNYILIVPQLNDKIKNLTINENRNGERMNTQLMLLKYTEIIEGQIGLSIVLYHAYSTQAKHANTRTPNKIIDRNQIT